MKRQWVAIWFFLLCLHVTVLPADEPLPVRMGCGRMTFDTVPGWGLRPDGRSALGPTRGVGFGFGFGRVHQHPIGVGF